MWIADPKAISHILKNSDTLYGKPNSARELVALVVDRGLVWADGSAFSNLSPSQILTWIGDAHKRQRRAMSPAFGLVEAKGLLPYFAQSANKVSGCLCLSSGATNKSSPQLANKWHELIEGSAPGESLVIDTPLWLSKATLDAYVTTPETPTPHSRACEQDWNGCF